MHEVIGTGLGLLLGEANDRRQIRQQRELQQLQMEGQKEMGKFNQELAMDLWERTNLKAQREQMEKAGFSPGLMMSKGGAPGSTNTPTGNVTGANAQQNPGEAAMGLQIGLQAAMQQAQIENIKANTQKTKVDTAKTAGVDTEEAKGRIAKLGQETQNAAIQAATLEYEKEIAKIESEIKGDSAEHIVRSAAAAADKLEAEANKAGTEANIAKETIDAIVSQAKMDTIEQTIRIAAGRKGLIKTDADTAAVNKGIQQMAQNIATMRHDIRMDWEKWGQEEKERWVKEQIAKNQTTQTEFNTSLPAQIKQWTDIVSEIMKAMPK